MKMSTQDTKRHEIDGTPSLRKKEGTKSVAASIRSFYEQMIPAIFWLVESWASFMQLDCVVTKGNTISSSKRKGSGFVGMADMSSQHHRCHLAVDASFSYSKKSNSKHGGGYSQDKAISVTLLRYGAERVVGHQASDH